MAEEFVTVPRDALDALYMVWDTWWNRVDCYDPGNSPEMKGIASLLGADGSFEMDEATSRFEPHEPSIRRALGLHDPRLESAS